MEGKGEEELEAQTSLRSETSRSSGMAGGHGAVATSSNASSTASISRKGSGSKIRNFMRGLTGSEKKDELDDGIPGQSSELEAAEGNGGSSTPKIEAIEPQSSSGLRRVLYTANVGDARAVLW